MGLLQILAKLCDFCLGKRLEKTTGSVDLNGSQFSYNDSTLGSHLQFFPLLFMPDRGHKRLSTHISLKQNPPLISMKICEDERQSPANALERMMMMGMQTSFSRQI